MKIVEVYIEGHTMYEVHDSRGCKLAGPGSIDRMEAALALEYERAAERSDELDELD